MTGVTIHIVDDDGLVLEILAAFAEEAGYHVRTHLTAEAFLSEVVIEEAGCVVADVNLPGIDGLDLMRRVAARDPDLPVIVVSGAARVAPAVAALKGGAMDFLQKPVARAVFARSLADALDRRVARAAARCSRDQARNRARRLSGREWEVMRLITDGASNQACAGRLGISVRTVENHRARVMEKMGASSLSDLIRKVLALAEADRAQWEGQRVFKAADDNAYRRVRAEGGGETTPTPR